MKLNNKGFTLVEVLAVIVIIGIIGGIAILSVVSSINSGKEASYKMMISNIVTASGLLYEEVAYGGSTLYQYTASGNSNSKISVNDSDNIETNLQTLVSNGFLNGTNNECTTSCSNDNKKIILDPKTKKDIGNCKITISKNGNKYVVENNGSSGDCPTEYKKEVK